MTDEEKANLNNELMKMRIQIYELEKRQFTMEGPEECDECGTDAVDFKENGDMIISGICNSCYDSRRMSDEK